MNTITANDASARCFARLAAKLDTATYQQAKGRSTAITEKNFYQGDSPIVEMRQYLTAQTLRYMMRD